MQSKQRRKQRDQEEGNPASQLCAPNVEEVTLSKRSVMDTKPTLSNMSNQMSQMIHDVFCRSRWYGPCRSSIHSNLEQNQMISVGYKIDIEEQKIRDG